MEVITTKCVQELLVYWMLDLRQTVLIRCLLLPLTIDRDHAQLQSPVLLLRVLQSAWTCQSAQQAFSTAAGPADWQTVHCVHSSLPPATTD